VTERFLSPKEVKELTGRGIQTLANERSRGEGIPFYRVGRSIKYRMPDVLNYMENCRVNTRAVRLPGPAQGQLNERR